jgi:hypothetical protein
MSEMKVGKINETYVIENTPYESHRRGKNYAAKITGLDPKYIFARKFLGKGGEHGQYILPGKPVAGEVYEIQAIYHSGGGNPSPNQGSGFYELLSEGIFKSLSKDEVKTKFQQATTETF